MPRLCITAASGKLGSATLRNILEHDLIPGSELVVSTTSASEDPRWDSIKARGVQIRTASYDDQSSMEKSFAGCKEFFLISTPKIQLDFHDAPPGKGRESAHFRALEAARIAGVKHVYYSSLAFSNGDESHAAVMTAHLRTETKLKQQTDFTYTIIREGLYHSSWPTYFGYTPAQLPDREELPIGGDGPMSWTAIDDLGLANGIVMADQSGKYINKTITLSNTESPTLADVAALVSKVSGNDMRTKIVDPETLKKHHLEERGMDSAYYPWFATFYDGIKRNECIKNDPSLSDLLAQYARKPLSFPDYLQQTLCK